MNKKTWGDFPFHNLGGHEFQAVPRSKLPFGGEGDDIVLVPVRQADDKLDFPGQAPLDSAGPFLKGGIAKHKVDFIARPDLWSFQHSDIFQNSDASDLKPLGGANPGVTARELVIFSEDDWYGECFQVLRAHKWWLGAAEIAPELLDRVIEIEGNPSLIDEAKEQYGDSYESYLLEVVAKHLAAPLSRVWYAANMMSLYYAHEDDLRLGFLWAEYQIKMRSEMVALKHINMTERARENGAKGGLGAKRAERYEVLDRLMTDHREQFLHADDKGRLRLAKGLGSNYDKQAEKPLFQERNQNLSSDWYSEWVEHFRNRVSKRRLV